MGELGGGMSGGKRLGRSEEKRRGEGGGSSTRLPSVRCNLMVDPEKVMPLAGLQKGAKRCQGLLYK